MRAQYDSCRSPLSNAQPYRVSFETLGCKVNRYETDAVRSLFREAGFVEVPWGAPCDVAVVNTCAVTGEAERKSGQALRKARRANPAALVVAMGCASQLSDRLPADLRAGTQGRSRLPQQVLERLARHPPGEEAIPDSIPGPWGPLVRVSGARIPFEEMGSVLCQDETRAFLKIEDGCDHACTYCAIRLARGPARSREEPSILEEARRLAEAGFRELVLTGIHVCSYGADRGEAGIALPRLLDRLAGIGGIDRIRLGSLEPTSLEPGLVAALAAHDRICPHFHVSLQSGSRGVLRRMGRRYDPEKYADALDRLRTAIPGAAVTTDLMVGFPGETEEEFAESEAFCLRMAFAGLHVFRFSPRPGTAAARFPDPVPAPAVARRMVRMLALASRLSAAYRTGRIGSRDTVLLETRHPDGSWIGHTADYLQAFVPEDTLSLAGPPLRSGLLVPVRITGLREDGVACAAAAGDGPA